MNRFAVIAIVSAGITASNAFPTFAQAPRRFVPRTGQPNNIYRPPPTFTPSVPSPPAHVVVDARGNRFVAVERIVSVWDPMQGRWVLGRTQELNAHGTIQSRPPVNLGSSKAQGTKPTGPNIYPGIGAAQGTNQIGQPAAHGTKPTGRPVDEEFGAARGTNQIGQPQSSNNAPFQPQASAPVAAIGVNAPGQPLYASNSLQGPVTTGPQPLYAANLGIYYLQVPYDNGTFGAKLTSAPVQGKPASTLPLDTNDIIFVLNNKRFTYPDDLLNYVGQTTVGYIDWSTNTTQSGTILIPPPAS